MDLEHQAPTDVGGKETQRVEDVLWERLAAIEHERWAHWQRWMHDQCARNEDGSLTIPPDLVERWERQIATPYEQLSEREKQSDRAQVARWWPLIQGEI